MVPVVGAAAGAPSSDQRSTMMRISDRPVSWPTGAAPARHILMPLYCAGLCEAVNIAPGRSRLPEAKYSWSVEQSPIRVTSAPSRAAPRANAPDRPGDEGRMSWPTTIASAPVTRTNAAPNSSASVSSH